MTERNRLIRQWHTLLTERGISNGVKMSLLAAYGAESSRDLKEADLRELVTYVRLNVNVSDEQMEMDRWRKSVIKVISKCLKLDGYTGKSCEYVKGVAMRAAEADSFNAIPKQQLINLYHAFRRKARVTKMVMRAETTEYEMIN